MYNNANCVHKRGKIVYIKIRIGVGGYGFCVHRLARSNFISEKEN